jgi:hypothetical protein
MSEHAIESTKDEAKRRLDRRLDSIAWALFLIMIGGLGLVPDEQVPEGTWLIGVGLIWLGLNGARYLNDIKVSGFTTVLGVVALLAGSSDLLGVDLPLLPILLILLGANILFKAFVARD